jgi:hypothetical protein
MTESSLDPIHNNQQELGSGNSDRLIVNQPIRRFAFRGKLPDIDDRKPRRRRKSPEPEIPRVKSDAELREEAAWKQVEEIGKPVILDDCLLVPNGMSALEAIEFLPDGVREQTEEAWNAKLTEVYRIFLEGAERQLREKAEKDGKLEWYDSLPWAARAALKESVVRQQLGYPEVPLEELIRQYQKPLDGVETELQRKKRSKRTPQKAKIEPPYRLTANSDANQQASERASGPMPSTLEANRVSSDSATSLTQTGPVTNGNRSETTIPVTVAEEQTNAALQWNREHHPFLLKRLDQIWAYFDAEEQQAVEALLNRRIRKEEIEQIDEIVKGVEWVRRLEK